MKVKKLSGKVQDAQQIPTLFDNENITYHPIDIVNWKEYPYQPQVSFRIAYTNDAILVHYKVVEDSVRAKYGEDNGSVWTDSCVEFFSIPAGDGIYYNLECNCIATILLAAGSERNNREMAPSEITDQVKRWASLGRETFEEKIAWVVTTIGSVSTHITIDTMINSANNQPLRYRRAHKFLPIKCSIASPSFYFF